MPVQINFLRQRRKAMTSVQKSDKRYATILAYITAGVTVVSFILLLYQYYLSSQLDSIKRQQRETQAKIASLSSVELEYLTLNQKFSEIQQLVKDKSLRQAAIEFFTTLFAQQGVTLTEVVFESDGVVRFNVSSKDIFQLEQLMKTLQGKQVLGAYPGLSLSDLSREKTGMYNTSVAVALPIATPVPVAPKKSIKLPGSE